MDSFIKADNPVSAFKQAVEIILYSVRSIKNKIIRSL